MNQLNKQIKNYLPYLIIIATYFFALNIFALKTSNNKELATTKEKINLDVEETNQRIRIPVIPYNLNN